MESTQKIKLSFIVPIYGVEHYLHKCVDSLLHQDYDNYEIILVDDGSPDGCPAICDEYAAKFDNIRAIHRENGGLSAARNSGIKVARGEYICFVDSDDYWEENVLGCLIAQVEREKLDVLRFGYQNVRICDGKYEVFRPYKYTQKPSITKGVVEGDVFLNDRMWYYNCYACQFVLKRSILLSSEKCLFREEILYEDTEWTPRMLCAAKRVSDAQTIVYNYLMREGSITQVSTWEKRKKAVESKFIVIETLNKLMEKTNYKQWLLGCISDNVYSIINTISEYDYSNRTYWVDKIKKSHVLPLVAYRAPRNVRIKYALMNVSIRWYMWMMHHVVYRK